MTTLLFRDDAYLIESEALVLGAGADGIRLDRTVFYPTGGGQPGDCGVLSWAGGETPIVDTVKDKGSGEVLHIPAEGAALPPAGAVVRLKIDWDRRYRHMRMHTAMHLLCAVVPGSVTGGQVGAEKSRLDFDIAAADLNKEEIEDKLNALIAANHKVDALWITDEELLAQPELVRTLSVKPPMGAGRVRLIKIGEAIDYQPCGGTHVRETGEIGPLALVKIENKGKQNRRISIAFKG